MIAAIHQPQFLPWLGYFDKMKKADAFCYLDNVQYKKNEWQNRNQIKSSNGRTWITVPVQYRFPQKIYEVKVNNRTDWKKKHLLTIASCYGKSNFFKEYISFFQEMYNLNWDRLVDLNIYGSEQLRQIFGISLEKVVVASKLELSDHPTDRLIDICHVLGCDTYLSGSGGRNYLELERFQARGVKVVFQDFEPPLYTQRFGEYLSHLSVIDWLFNCGTDGNFTTGGIRK